MKKLEAKGLGKFFGGRKVVDGVTLDLKPAKIVGLLGPNGAGKTTTFSMIVGSIKPDEGRVFLNGEDITDFPMYLRARRGLVYLPQESSIFRGLTVEGNIRAILETLNLSKIEREERLEVLLADLGIPHLAKRKANTLSGGERRRVEIVRALVTSPSFMLLDEPFTGIDPITIGDIQEIILRLKDKGIGIFISDHNVRETLSVCNKAYILDQGKILEMGSPQKITGSKKARQIYLGERFRL